MSVIIGKFEVSFWFPRLVIGAKPQVVVQTMRIDHLSGIHLPIWIPNGLVFAERLNDFMAEHLRQQLRARLYIAVFTGERASITHDQVGSFFRKSAIGRNALRGEQVEGNAAVNAAHSEVAIQGGHIVVFVEKLAEVAQVVPNFVGRDGRVLPSWPRRRQAGYERGGAQA